MKRLTAKQYAELIGAHDETIARWCRNAAKPDPLRNKSLPPIVARKLGRDWKIDVAATERVQSLTCGTALERELVKNGLM